MSTRDEFEKSVEKADYGQTIYEAMWNGWCLHEEHVGKELSDLLKVEEQAQGMMWCASLKERLEHVLQHYRGIATDHLAGVKRFKDDMIVFLRALSLMLEMVGNGYTHQEKGARLRGMIELLEGNIEKLQNAQLDFTRTYWHWEDAFKSDFPTRELVRRIHELESEVETLKKEKHDQETT